MKTRVTIDKGLLAEALKLPGINTNRQAIEKGLRLLVKTHRQMRIRRLRGSLKWEGSLDDMRRDF